MIYLPANIYLFKVNNKNSRKSCEIYSKLTKKPTRMMSMTWVLVFFLLTLHMFHTFFYCCYCWIWANKSLLATHLRPLSPSYRNQLINLNSKLTGFYMMRILVKKFLHWFCDIQNIQDDKYLFKIYSENTNLIKWINPKLLR